MHRPRSCHFGDGIIKFTHVQGLSIENGKSRVLRTSHTPYRLHLDIAQSPDVTSTPKTNETEFPLSSAAQRGADRLQCCQTSEHRLITRVTHARIGRHVTRVRQDHPARRHLHTLHRGPSTDPGDCMEVHCRQGNECGQQPWHKCKATPYRQRPCYGEIPPNEYHP